MGDCPTELLRPQDAAVIQCEFPRAGRGPGQRGQRSSGKSRVKDLRRPPMAVVPIIGPGLCRHPAEERRRNGQNGRDRRAPRRPRLRRCHCMFSLLAARGSREPAVSLRDGLLDSYQTVRLRGHQFLNRRAESGHWHLRGSQAASRAGKGCPLVRLVARLVRFRNGFGRAPASGGP